MSEDGAVAEQANQGKLHETGEAGLRRAEAVKLGAGGAVLLVLKHEQREPAQGTPATRPGTDRGRRCHR